MFDGFKEEVRVMVRHMMDRTEIKNEERITHAIAEMRALRESDRRELEAALKMLQDQTIDVAMASGLTWKENEPAHWVKVSKKGK